MKRTERIVISCCEKETAGNSSKEPERHVEVLPVVQVSSVFLS